MESGVAEGAAAGTLQPAEAHALGKGRAAGGGGPAEVRHCNLGVFLCENCIVRLIWDFEVGEKKSKLHLCSVSLF